MNWASGLTGSRKVDFSWLTASSVCRASASSLRAESAGEEERVLCKEEEEQQQQRRNYGSLKNTGMIHGLPNCDHLVNP
jgi:hypothetical protein